MRAEEEERSMGLPLPPPFPSLPPTQNSRLTQRVLCLQLNIPKFGKTWNIIANFFWPEIFLNFAKQKYCCQVNLWLPEWPFPLHAVWSEAAAALLAGGAAVAERSQQSENFCPGIIIIWQSRGGWYCYISLTFLGVAPIRNFVQQFLNKNWAAT